MRPPLHVEPDFRRWTRCGSTEPASCGQIEAVKKNQRVARLLADLRRAAERPLGTNALPAGFRVEVPITYRLERR